ncbi:serine/threonine-protein kinase [Nocardia altamirensis]|uniref:serine/threonine-protein kinase n=1 Tax=Nocardia altamirensis TaxID=472158 RepID=UPI000840095C|nr:serine/threonine-protein kinase [Nocardia altamirensis]
MNGPPTRIGTRFGRYQLRSLLGRGGMGEVYEAYDTEKDRVVAVKLLPTHLAKDPMFQQRFRHESQAAARLAEPHVIPIHDWGEIDGVLYIDMRLVRGHDLRSVLRGAGPLSPLRAIGIIEQIAAALDAAHAEGLVHRDVKPANILVTASDFAYLADFGIARSTRDTEVTGTGAAAVGSYSYIAPERFEHGPVTGTADVYSLACVLYECLTGMQPFPANAMSVLIHSHLSMPPPRPSAKRAGVPAALDEVVVRGMAKEPTARYATAGGLASAARSALTGRAVVAVTELPTDQMMRPKAPPTIVFPALGPDRLSPNALPTDAVPRQSKSEPVRREPHRVGADAMVTGQVGSGPSVGGSSHPGPVRETTGGGVREESHPGAVPPRGSGRVLPPGESSRAVDEQADGRKTTQRESAPAAPATASARPKRQGRRFLMAGAVVLVALAAGVGWTMRDQLRDQFSSSGPAPTTLAPVPPNAVGCEIKYPPVGRFVYSAIGNSATTCGFAEEVRKSYGQEPEADGTRKVDAVSPRTQQTYTLDCTTRDGLVTCHGGENALVYIY